MHAASFAQTNQTEKNNKSKSAVVHQCEINDVTTAVDIHPWSGAAATRLLTHDRASLPASAARAQTQGQP
jgi:hypothetical protein